MQISIHLPFNGGTMCHRQIMSQTTNKLQMGPVGITLRAMWSRAELGFVLGAKPESFPLPLTTSFNGCSS